MDADASPRPRPSQHHVLAIEDAEPSSAQGPSIVERIMAECIEDDPVADHILQTDFPFT